MKNYIGDGYLENITDIIQTKHKNKKVIISMKDGYCCEMEVKASELKKTKLEGIGDIAFYGVSIKPEGYVRFNLKIESKKDCVLHLYANSIQILSLCKIVTQ